jgi:hypothetical protein
MKNLPVALQSGHSVGLVNMITSERFQGPKVSAIYVTNHTATRFFPHTKTLTILFPFPSMFIEPIDFHSMTTFWLTNGQKTTCQSYPIDLKAEIAFYDKIYIGCHSLFKTGGAPPGLNIK